MDFIIYEGKNMKSRLLCNTKVFFQTQGIGINYIKEYFSNKEDLERLKRLPLGQAFITSKGKHEPKAIIIQRLTKGHHLKKCTKSKNMPIS